MNRKAITCEALQAVITRTVRESGECEAFIGIIVRRIIPRCSGDLNWTVWGVRYGKAERSKCDAAISAIVEELQKEFTIFD